MKGLRAEMLCLADRGFFSYKLWKKALGTGADLLWPVPNGLVLPLMERFEDGSSRSQVYPSRRERERDRNGLVVRVIEFKLEGLAHGEEGGLYRFVTTLLDPEEAPARDLAALYHERWAIETAFDELKIHLRGRAMVLRSRTPELVRQAFYGLLLAHFAVRDLMHEAALGADIDRTPSPSSPPCRWFRSRLHPEGL